MVVFYNSYKGTYVPAGALSLNLINTHTRNSRTNSKVSLQPLLFTSVLRLFHLSHPLPGMLFPNLSKPPSLHSDLCSTVTSAKKPSLNIPSEIHPHLHLALSFYPVFFILLFTPWNPVRMGLLSISSKGTGAAQSKGPCVTHWCLSSAGRVGAP